VQRCPHCNETLDDGLVPICWHCGFDMRGARVPQLAANPVMKAPPRDTNAPEPTRAPAAPTPAAQAAVTAQLGQLWRQWQLPVLGLAALAAGAVFAFMARPSSNAAAAAPFPSSASQEGSAQPTPAELEEAPDWIVPRAPGHTIDGSQLFTLQLDALRGFTVGGQHIRPVLAVRCMGRQTEVFVSLGTSASLEAGEGHTVTIRFDQEPAATERWESSSTYQELFAPDGVALARRLARTGILQFGFTPYNSPPVAVQFIVQGLDQHIANVSRLCRWPAERAPRSTRSLH
jgi:hypothetical protein